MGISRASAQEYQIYDILDIRNADSRIAILGKRLGGDPRVCRMNCAVFLGLIMDCRIDVLGVLYRLTLDSLNRLSGVRMVGFVPPL